MHNEQYCASIAPSPMTEVAAHMHCSIAVNTQGLQQAVCCVDVHAPLVIHWLDQYGKLLRHTDAME